MKKGMAIGYPMIGLIIGALLILSAFVGLRNALTGDKPQTDDVDLNKILAKLSSGDDHTLGRIELDDGRFIVAFSGEEYFGQAVVDSPRSLDVGNQLDIRDFAYPDDKNDGLPDRIVVTLIPRRCEAPCFCIYNKFTSAKDGKEYELPPFEVSDFPEFPTAELVKLDYYDPDQSQFTCSPLDKSPSSKMVISRESVYKSSNYDPELKRNIEGFVYGTSNIVSFGGVALAPHIGKDYGYSYFFRNTANGWSACKLETQC